VVERAACPVRRVVALGAILRESGLDVIWIGRGLKVRLVAGKAGCAVWQVVRTRGAERGVVALCALQRDVSAGQREAGGRVIEIGASPAGGVVALGAVLRETGLDVIRITGAVEVRLMAGEAGCAVWQVVRTRGAERGVVALCALQRDVSAGQREAGGRVIEIGASPAGGVVALGAVL
jgi:predicted RNA-binding Zn ribbon-like protein